MERIGREIESNIIDSDKIENFRGLTFNQQMQFDIRISQLHRCAKLCISVNIINRKRKVLKLISISI